MNETMEVGGALLASLIEAMPEPVLVVSDTVRLVAANGPARALFPQLRLQAPLTTSLRAVDLHDAIARVLNSGQAENISWLDRVPVERLFQVHVAAFQSSPARFVALTLHDATESRRLEQMRVDFVANASHELRTPLASLLGFIETLQGPARNDAGRARALSRHHARTGAAHGAARRRSSVAVADRAAPASASRAPVDLVGIRPHIVDALTPMAHDKRVDLNISRRRCDGARRPRRTAAGRRKSDRKRDQIWRRRTATVKRQVDVSIAARASACARECAITARALRPNICRA